MKKYIVMLMTGIVLLIYAGCASTSQQVLGTQESQVQIRSIQSRSFDTADKNLMMRNVISSLQDLEFVIDAADELLGTVSATKFIQNNALVVSVSVKAKGDTQMVVRLNAQYGTKTVEDPKAYQDFFTVLEKSIFLTANQVD